VADKKRKKGGGRKRNPLNPSQKKEFRQLRNLNMDFYGVPGDEATLKKYARREKPQDWRVKAGQATRDKQALRAGKTVSSELNPQISANKNYQAGLEKLYAGLAAGQGTIAKNITQGNTAARSRMATGYDDLASQISSEFRGARDSSNAELSRMGIQGMGDASQSGDIESRLAMLAQSGKQNALSSQEMQSSGFDQLMGLLQGQSQMTGAATKAASQQKLNDLIASRPNKVYSLYQQYEDQARAEAAERKQSNFLNRITKARLGIEQDYKGAQSLGELAKARKDIVDSRRPSSVKRPRRR
jgi:hypothetical protein